MSDHQSAPTTIDSEVERIITAVWADGTYAGNAYKGHETIAPETAAQAITNLIAQEANKAVVKELENIISNPGDWSENTEFGIQEQARERIAQITADKEQADG